VKPVASAAAGLAAAVVAALAAAPALAVPSFDAVRAAHAPSDLPLLDRHGAVLQMVRVDERVRRGPWLTLADISPALRHAIVLGEDRRFWDHGGVDWRALAAGSQGRPRPTVLRTQCSSPPKRKSRASVGSRSGFRSPRAMPSASARVTNCA